MIPDSLSAVWTAIAPAMANHLWQSTLFAAAAAVLTLVLRKNPARVRYRLWLVASVKFLIPFSLLVSLGGHLARPHVTESAQTGLYSVAQELSQPFTRLPLRSLCQFHARRVLPICSPGSKEFSQPCGRAVLLPCSVYGGGAGGDSLHRCGARRPLHKDARCMHCDAWSKSPECERRSCSCFQRIHWSPASSASFGQYWYGRRESLNTLRVRIWRRSSLMRYATCAAAII